MQRRILANMASFYTEQQSVDVREGMERRVKEGLFVGHAPYGYRNVRRSGRSLVEVNGEQAENVRRIFNLYAYHGHTIDSLREALRKAEIQYTAAQSDLSRAKVHQILRDRCYIGEVQYRGEWYPRTHPAIVEHAVWERVQALLGSKSTGHMSSRTAAISSSAGTAVALSRVSSLPSDRRAAKSCTSITVARATPRTAIRAFAYRNARSTM